MSWTRVVTTKFWLIVVDRSECCKILNYYVKYKWFTNFCTKFIFIGIDEQSFIFLTVYVSPRYLVDVGNQSQSIVNILQNSSSPIANRSSVISKNSLRFSKKPLSTWKVYLKIFTTYIINFTYDSYLKSVDFYWNYFARQTKTDQNMIEKIYNYLRWFIQHYRYGDNRRWQYFTNFANEQ